MPTHRISSSASVIAGLTELGRSLGYDAHGESPVEPSSSEAVDIGWYGAKNDRVPLFIFEVESRLTNAAASNPIKVLGRKTEEVEKPLFLFHVFVRGGQRSNKLEALRTVLGTHSYRIYRLSAGDFAALLSDVFAQHRRHTNRIDLVRVAHALQSDVWDLGPILIGAALDAIERNGFESDDDTLLPGYARLALSSDFYLARYRDFLKSYIGTTARRAAYPSFIGHYLQEPIHIGICGALTQSADPYLALFTAWQQDWGIEALGPPFGRSLDHDEFAIGQSPSFLVLVAGLLGPASFKPVYDELATTLTGLRPGSHLWAFVALWMLNLCARSMALRQQFESLRDQINEWHSIPRALIYLPPAAIDIENDRWLTSSESPDEAVASFDEFRASIVAPGTSEDVIESSVRLAIRSMLQDLVNHDWERDVMRLIDVRSDIGQGADT